MVDATSMELEVDVMAVYSDLKLMMVEVMQAVRKNQVGLH